MSAVRFPCLSESPNRETHRRQGEEYGQDVVHSGTSPSISLYVAGIFRQGGTYSVSMMIFRGIVGQRSGGGMKQAGKEARKGKGAVYIGPLPDARALDRGPSPINAGQGVT